MINLKLFNQKVLAFFMFIFLFLLLPLQSIRCTNTTDVAQSEKTISKKMEQAKNSLNVENKKVANKNALNNNLCKTNRDDKSTQELKIKANNIVLQIKEFLVLAVKKMLKRIAEGVVASIGVYAVCNKKFKSNNAIVQAVDSQAAQPVANSVVS